MAAASAWELKIRPRFLTSLYGGSQTLMMTRILAIRMFCGRLTRPSSFVRLDMFDKVAYMRAYNAAYRKEHAKKLAEGKRLWAAQDKKKFPEKYLLKKRRYRKLHAKKHAETTARYLALNKKRIKAVARRYYERNRAEILAKSRARARQNRKKLTVLLRHRRRKDPDFRLRGCLRHRVWMALKGKTKSDSTMGLIGCSLQELKKHLESKFKPGMTWKNYGPVWHVDHLKPCAKFDLTDPEQQKICFHWTNLQPLFKAENMCKGDRSWE